MPGAFQLVSYCAILPGLGVPRGRDPTPSVGEIRCMVVFHHLRNLFS
jgi:hypothetical protein